MRTLLAIPAALALVSATAMPASAATAEPETVADASVVVLVSGEDAHLVDALAVAPLLLSTDSDLELVSDKGLSADVEARVQSAETVYVIGGVDAISEDIFDQVSDLTGCIRLGGADRYETSLAINAEVDSILGVGLSVNAG